MQDFASENFQSASLLAKITTLSARKITHAMTNLAAQKDDINNIHNKQNWII